MLWIMDKKDGNCFSDKGVRNKALAENNYNPDEVEELLHQIESSASSIVKKVIESARCGSVPNLTLIETEQLCNFLFVQKIRIPRVKNWVMSNQWEHPQDKKYLWRMCSDLAANIFIDDLEAAKANVNLTEHPYMEKIICTRMMDMKINVLRINGNAGTAFLIGDEPCLFEGFLARSGDYVTMPLAKDVFIEMRRPEDSTGGIYDASKVDIEQRNLQSYVQAERFVVGPSRYYLTIVRERAKKFKLGLDRS